ncbi:MAG: hypothetical protein HZA93_10205 [Verrucomicrobia bacterium]|nr:hypothetical protein [Verrucomicrobiota bacterium]
MSRAAAVLSLLFTFLGLAGCEAVSSGVRDRFGDFPGRTEIVPGARRDVYHQTQTTLKRLGFQLSRSAEAQGIVEAFSPIQPGDATRNARQLTVEIRLTDLGPKETEVTIWLRESLEGGLAIGAAGTRQPLRDHGLYASLFGQLRKPQVESPSAPAK